MGWRTLKIVLVLLLVLFPVAGTAEITQAVISVNGMSCPFCAFGVEKKLKAVAGTAEVTVAMKEGTATLIAGSGESLDVGRIGEAVRKAGFTPGLLRITAIGTLQQGTDGLRLQMNDDSLRIQTDGLSLRQIEQLDALRVSARSVRISGILDAAETKHPLLTLDKIEEVAP